MIDPNTPVAKLCAEGMASEGQGNMAEAAKLFREAWDQSSNSYERCISAHYVARHQPTPEDALNWNIVAMEEANKSDENLVGAFYPSLFLCVGKSHEDLGNVDEARKYYELAQSKSELLPEGPYGDLVRTGICEALKRV